MITFLIIFAVVALMIAFQALYVAAEFSTIRVRKTRLTQLAESGNALARQLLPIKNNPESLDKYIAACQLGITASSLVLGAYGQNSVAPIMAGWLVSLGDMAEPLARTISSTTTLAIFTVAQMVLGELVPKSLSVQYPAETAMATLVPTRWSEFILTPFIWFFNGSGNVALKLLRLDQISEHSHIHSPNEIELLVSSSYEEGIIDEKEQQFLRNAFRLRDLTARQVMIPQTQLITASTTDPAEEILQRAMQTGFTRIPIYEESLDRITHFVHIKELFRLHARNEQDIAPVLRQVTYIPETTPILDVWHKLNETRQYLAIVFDEYGATVGLITFEDLLEEVFGELQDEFDDNESAIMYKDPKVDRIHLRADLLVADLNEYFELSLPEDESDTIGGLVFSQLGRPPEAGDEVRIADIPFRVEKVHDQRVLAVSLELPEDAPPPTVDEWEVMGNE